VLARIVSSDSPIRVDRSARPPFRVDGQLVFATWCAEHLRRLSFDSELVSDVNGHPDGEHARCARVERLDRALYADGKPRRSQPLEASATTAACP
jgi:hypothetical protein